MKTLLEFASEKLILTLLIKERVKCSSKYKRRVSQLANKRNTQEQGPSTNLNSQSELDAELPKLDLLTSIFPSRNSWVQPRKRKAFIRPNGSQDRRKLNAKAIKFTIDRDRKRLATLKEKSLNDTLSDEEIFILTKLNYLGKLDAYIKFIQDKIGSSDPISFSSPLLRCLYKNEKTKDDGTVVVTYRPLSIYVEFIDKIILAITSRYLMSMFNWYLHPNILSYRSPRDFLDKKHYVTNFNDGIRLIRRYKESHPNKQIYVADCDIKKFYDTINHNVVRDCFNRMLDASDLTNDGKKQVMRILNAYLNSYNFYEQVMLKSQSQEFWNRVKSKRPRSNAEETYQFDWVSEEDFAQCYGGKKAFQQQLNKIGVPQGGSLSLMIADVVLNDVDQMTMGDELPKHTISGEDTNPQNLLFIRFCDDMVLMHTDASRCKGLIDQYGKSLAEHKLIYHPFTEVKDVKDGNSTLSDFWKAKSHDCFCWSEGEGNASAWIGFLGYEMHCDGSIRLRKSNVQKNLDKIRKQHFTMKRLLRKEELCADQLISEIGRGESQLSKSIKTYEEIKPGNRHILRQLVQLDQHRKHSLRHISCRSAKAKCSYNTDTSENAKNAKATDTIKNKDELRNAIRSYLSKDYSFKQAWEDLLNGN